MLRENLRVTWGDTIMPKLRTMGNTILQDYSKRNDLLDKLDSYWVFSEVTAELPQRKYFIRLFDFAVSEEIPTASTEDTRINPVIGASRQLLRMMTAITQICAFMRYDPEIGVESIRKSAYKRIKDLDQILPEIEELPVGSKEHTLLLDIADTYKEGLLIYCLCRAFKSASLSLCVPPEA